MLKVQPETEVSVLFIMLGVYNAQVHNCWTPCFFAGGGNGGRRVLSVHKYLSGSIMSIFKVQQEPEVGVLFITC